MASPTTKSLLSLLNIAQCECLNEDHETPLSPFLKKQSCLLKSNDCDPQLLIKLAFTVPVKLSSIYIKAETGASDRGTYPSKIRTFINRDNISFAEAESDAPIEEFELEANATEEGYTIPLRFVKYQKVSTLVIFVEDNGGGEITEISAIDVFGTEVDALQMKDWKPLKPEEMIAQND